MSAFLLLLPLLNSQPLLSGQYPFARGWPFNKDWIVQLARECTFSYLVGILNSVAVEGWGEEKSASE